MSGLFSFVYLEDTKATYFKSSISRSLEQVQFKGIAQRFSDEITLTWQPPEHQPPPSAELAIWYENQKN